MRKINFNHFDRASLADSQKEFLSRLIPFTVLTERFVWDKVDELKLENAVPQSIFSAHSIIITSWGEENFVEKGNNLFGIGPYGCWDGKNMQCKGLKYRVYEDWLECVSDYVDLASFFLLKEFKFVFSAGGYESTLEEYCRAWEKRGIALEKDSMVEIIKKFGLYEFDSYAKQ